MIGCSAEPFFWWRAGFMLRRPFALVLVVALAGSAPLRAQAQKDKKQDEAQKKEIQNVVKVVDDVAAGQQAPDDLSIAWVREDVLKAQGNKEYVPFTVTIDPAKVGGGKVAFYWRVVAKGAATPTATDGQKKDDKKDQDRKKTDYAYEDVSFIEASGAGPLRISRSFTVTAGDYDVFIVAKEPTPEKPPKNAPPPKMSVLKRSVTVPDFWNGELNTSTLMVAQRIDPLPAPLTPEQQADRPYALGTMEIIPAIDTKFTKKSELSTFMLIYNPKTDSANKPDVLVEYNFCQTAAGNEPKAGEPCKAGEKFFNKTNPQNLNAQTLPPAFDLAAGHQLQSGQAVPLASFPEGDYRLEVKVTDKIANKSLTREVNLSVAP
jgi:hypothetical protein